MKFASFSYVRQASVYAGVSGFGLCAGVVTRCSFFIVLTLCIFAAENNNMPDMTQLVITLKDQSYLPNIRRIVKSLVGVPHQARLVDDMGAEIEHYR